VSRILVIDDAQVIRELMREILELGGYETVGADTPERALALLEEEEISLVISDIVMPGSSGLELLAAVRARHRGLPVILVTGAGTDENVKEAVARGADGLVIKPFSHADLRSAVAGALARAGDPTTRALAGTLRAGRGTQWDPDAVDHVLPLVESGELSSNPITHPKEADS
jgi:DNA-binding NtrC family response regulator